MHEQFRLIVVDDEKPQLEALCTLLEDAGFVVNGFADPAIALTQLHTVTHDVLLTDLRLPGMDGIELIQKARQIDPDISAVLMTGHGSIQSAVNAMKLGVLDYILKPFKVSDLMPVVHRAIEVRKLKLQNTQLIRDISSSNGKLLEMNHELDNFAGRVAHDLNSLCHIIQGFAGSLTRRASSKLDEQERRYLQRINESSARGGQLVSDLLAFARLGSGDLQHQQVVLNEVVEKARAQVEAGEGLREVDWTIAILPDIEGDESLLEQVFVNLLSNAMKFSQFREQPCISVEANIENGCVEIRVIDNGAGFDPDQADGLFKPFHRLHNAHDFEGHGMGLANVKRIIERHGGQISAQSAPDNGATFTLLIPLSQRNRGSIKQEIVELGDMADHDYRHAEDKLKRSEALQRIGGRLAKLGAWAIELGQLPKLYWSEEIFSILDIPKGQLPHSYDSALSYYHGKWRKIIQAALEKCSQQGVPFELEPEMRSATGRRFWARVVGEAVRDGKGNIIRIQGAFQDITESKLAVLTLMHMNRLLEAQHRVNEITATLDKPERLLQEVCRVFCSLGGLPLAWACEFGKDLSDLKVTAADGSQQEFVSQIMSTTTLPRDHELVNRLRAGQMHICQNVAEEPQAKMWHKQAIEEGLESFAILPVHAQGKLRASLVLFGAGVHFFNKEVRQLLKTVAKNLSLALENLMFAEERSHNAERLKLLETCVERLNDIVLITEAGPISGEGPKILYVNEAFVRRTGYTREEAIGQTPRFLQGELTQRDALDRIRHALTDWKPVREELINYTKSGETFWLELDIVPVADETGWYTHWVAIERDITERKQAEQRSDAQLTRMSLLNEITRAIGNRHDLDSIYQVVTNSIEKELPADFCLTASYSEQAGTITFRSMGKQTESGANKVGFFLHESIPARGVHLDRALLGEFVYQPNLGDSMCMTGEGMHNLVGLDSMVIAPLMNENKVLGIITTARKGLNAFSADELEFLRQLAEHVALALAQTLLLQELQNACHNLQRTQQLVLQQERLRALAEMAGGIAHDINNAISPVALYTDALLSTEKDLSERGQKQLKTIQLAIDDVARTVERMGKFCRQQDEGTKLTRVNLAKICEQSMELTTARWHDVPQRIGIPIEFRLHHAQDVPEIDASESELREALTNLILNAVDAMPNGGVITLSTGIDKRDGLDQVRIDLQDTGMGMNEETRRRCLEPFYTTKGERGTGLGLAMVYGIVKRMHGQIEIESEEKRGCTVTILLPAQ
ncbi:ATP-binding protein [Limnobacter sp.]|uniref:ATP-binding protein n=1 Tax=Limnobacter sp. TaxID=2003368 RepID=UPI002FE108C0